MNIATARKPGGLPWDNILLWGLLLLAMYGLRDVFFIALLTFLLSYLIRSIVVSIAQRLRPGEERPGLQRWLTLGVFTALVALLWSVTLIVGPQFVQQGRLLMTDAQHLNPQQTLNHTLSRTVGAYRFRQTYGDAEDPRFVAGLQQFESDGRIGEGAFAAFGRLRSRVQAAFEIAYERAEKQRLRDRVSLGEATSQGFEDWFLKVKAPALVAEQRTAYLARWRATRPPSADAAGAVDPKVLDHQLAELVLADIQTHPAELSQAEAEWEQAVVADEWRTFQASPAYRQAFQNWFKGQREQGIPIPYDLDTYLALRNAYTQGLTAFSQVYRAHLKGSTTAAEQQREDFQRARESDLARQWWAASPVAASLREHLRKDPAEAATAIAGRLEALMRALIAIPAQVATALLLTILITFDMAKLKKGALRLRETRIAPLYDKVVPNLVGVARLIGRSFAGQGLIALFNTLLTFALLRILGLQNELLLCFIVFIASFIPVLGVILSGIPIALQAVLQPDGSLTLALYALLGIATIHAIESTVLSPKIVGKILHIHPVLVMAVLIVAERLAGVWGLLLGVPLVVYLVRVAVLAEGIPGVYEPSSRPPAAD